MRPSLRTLLVLLLLSLLSLSCVGVDAKKHHHKHRRPSSSSSSSDESGEGVDLEQAQQAQQAKPHPHRRHHRHPSKQHHPRTHYEPEGEYVDASNIESMFPPQEQPATLPVVPTVLPDAEASPLPEVIDASNIEQAFAHHPSPLPASSNGGVHGVDVSQLFPSSAYKCLVDAGYHFTIVRAWRSSCMFDPNAVASIKAARQGGMKNIDVYVFPASTCSLSAAQQINATLDALEGTQFGMLWLDIESEGSNWQSAEQNYKWIQQAVRQVELRIGRKRLGIYTNRNNWQRVVNNVADFGDLPLWYAHYDKDPSYADWVPFGAWTKPAIKQYTGTTAICGASVDQNWYPL